MSTTVDEIVGGDLHAAVVTYLKHANLDATAQMIEMNDPDPQVVTVRMRRESASSLGHRKWREGEVKRTGLGEDDARDLLNVAYRLGAGTAKVRTREYVVKIRIEKVSDDE